MESRTVAKRSRPDEVVKFADMFSAMATEARLRILRLLLSAHPDGMVVGEVAEELDIPASTLSHHLDKLKNENLVQVQREGRTLHTYLAYYQRSRTHLALGKDAPEPRAVEPPEQGCVVTIHRSGDYTTDISDAPLNWSKPIAPMFPS